MFCAEITFLAISYVTAHFSVMHYAWMNEVNRINTNCIHCVEAGIRNEYTQISHHYLHIA